MATRKIGSGIRFTQAEVNQLRAAQAPYIAALRALRKDNKKPASERAMNSWSYMGRQTNAEGDVNRAWARAYNATETILRTKIADPNALTRAVDRLYPLDNKVGNPRRRLDAFLGNAAGGGAKKAKGGGEFVRVGKLTPGENGLLRGKIAKKLNKKRINKKGKVTPAMKKAAAARRVRGATRRGGSEG